MTTTIPPHDEYRAIIEDVDFRHHVVAKGTRSHCAGYLAEWLERNPLPPLHTAYVLRVVTRIPGPDMPTVVCGREVVS